MSDGPRVLFVTGPGGDGSSTVATATAWAAAREGQATLLLSAESAPRMAALLGNAPPVWPGGAAELTLPPPGVAGPGKHPHGSATRLHAARIDPGRAFRRGVLDVQDGVRPALEALGAVPFDDDELTELPGSSALAVLQALRVLLPEAPEAPEGGDGEPFAGRWQLVVVDLPPIAEALRLLALPEQLARYLRRLLPPERLTARALHPLLAQLAGIRLPVPDLFAAAERWQAELASLRQLMEAPGTAVRLVLDPATTRSIDAARIGRAGLALQGIAIESVIANRVLPPDLADPRLATHAARQRALLGAFADAARLSPVHELPHLGREPGPARLPSLSVPPPGPWGPEWHPHAAGHHAEPRLHDLRADRGVLLWRLPLPGATREDLDLVRRGEELVVTVGPFRRVLPLPAALRRCTVTGAALEEDGDLAVRFTPDPQQWPKGMADEG